MFPFPSTTGNSKQMEEFWFYCYCVISHDVDHCIVNGLARRALLIVPLASGKRYEEGKEESGARYFEEI